MSRLHIFVDFIAPEAVLEELRRGTAGHELVFPRVPGKSVLFQTEADPALETVDVAFGQPDPASILQSRRLKWVHISSSGITRYDTPEFRQTLLERGIKLSNSATVYQEACAVHALSFMLAQARKLPTGLETRTSSSNATWHGLREACSTLRGEKVLIVGYGAIARRLIELLRPFGMEILAYRRKARGNETVPLVQAGQLPATLGWADHVVNILPESRETRGFFDATRFSQVKPGAVFYNIGRGATVDQPALVDALRSGRIGAAWLDVTDPEPLPDNHPLWREPNCFITPHVAGGHRNEACTLLRHFLENLGRFEKGEELLDRVL